MHTVVTALLTTFITYLGFDYAPFNTAVTGPSTGAYANEQDCEADRAAQTTSFQVQTGAAVLKSECVTSQADESFVMKIETLQKPTKSLFVQVIASGTVTKIDQSALSQLVSRQGVQVVRTYAGHVYFYDKASTSSQRVNLRNEIAGVFVDRSECESQLASVQTAIQKISTQALAFCSTGYTEWVEVLMDAKKRVAFKTDPATFTDVRDCSLQAAKTVEKAKRENSRVVGGYCVYDGADAAKPFVVQLMLNDSN